MAVGQPPLPSASAILSSGRRFGILINLQAKLPFRRLDGVVVVGSLLSIPSGFVPGDREDDNGGAQRGGVGAQVLDCVSLTLSED